MAERAQVPSLSRPQAVLSCYWVLVGAKSARVFLGKIGVRRNESRRRKLPVTDVTVGDI